MTKTSNFHLYTKVKCDICEKTKSRLTEFGLTWDETVIGRDISRDDVLAKFPFSRFVPIIVDNKRNMTLEPGVLERYLKEHYDRD